MKGKVAISEDIRQMAESDWDYLMNINLKGVFRGHKIGIALYDIATSTRRSKSVGFFSITKRPLCHSNDGRLGPWRN